MRTENVKWYARYVYLNHIAISKQKSKQKTKYLVDLYDCSEYSFFHLFYRTCLSRHIVRSLKKTNNRLSTLTMGEHSYSEPFGEDMLKTGKRARRNVNKRINKEN